MWRCVYMWGGRERARLSGFNDTLMHRFLNTCTQQYPTLFPSLLESGGIFVCSIQT